ncbi:MAG TPA: hypothetical protein VGS97_11145 [Actinocrinis sp.]|uniref:hypothetical protein n=1 Tax=Actinocrinis sp. TaxID=1920516 RepID=UPI002DDD542E|nr:hypothetical protein [Actinocrinis sp.]HEV2344640.1 hypothetical protein [Actinocrinis sp.]
MTTPTQVARFRVSRFRRTDRRNGQSPLGHTTRAVLLLSATAIASEAVLAIGGGPGAAAAGAVAIVVVGLLVARYVAGADAIDGSHRRSVRLVHQREPSLRGWATAVESARESAAGFERVLRPQLERLYAVRLADRHGISLYREPDRAAAVVGYDVFAWIDPRRPTYSGPLPPRKTLDRRAQSASDPPPVPDVVLRALVHRLETL